MLGLRRLALGSLRGRAGSVPCRLARPRVLPPGGRPHRGTTELVSRSPANCSNAATTPCGSSARRRSRPHDLPTRARQALRHTDAPRPAPNKPLPPRSRGRPAEPAWHTSFNHSLTAMQSPKRSFNPPRSRASPCSSRLPTPKTRTTAYCYRSCSTAAKATRSCSCSTPTRSRSSPAPKSHTTSPSASTANLRRTCSSQEKANADGSVGRDEPTGRPLSKRSNRKQRKWSLASSALPERRATEAKAPVHAGSGGERACVERSAVLFADRVESSRFARKVGVS